MATGDYCETVSVAGASSSVLCGPKYALTTKYISMTDEELEGILKEKGALSDNGEIVEDSGLGELVAISGRRQSTVGIKDSSVCETYRQLHNDFLDTIFEGVGCHVAVRCFDKRPRVVLFVVDVEQFMKI
mgnify:CR=1 FL=1